MATNIKKLPADEFVLSGNGACAGCPATLALRMVGKALGSNAVMLMTPSCSVASMGMTPKTAFNWPTLNITFASAGSSAAGVAGAFAVMKEKGRLSGDVPTVFNWVGDGGTYDIGLQALSAAAERNDNFIHFCYNNEAYSNTGVQRSGATPRNTFTTTTPEGKRQPKKNMALLMLDHNVPYLATASIAYPGDLYDKVKKAMAIPGFKYIEIFAPCYTGWQFASKDTVALGREAAKTGAWLLWEAENGKISFSPPSDKIISGEVQREPIDGYLQKQGRFRKTLGGSDGAGKVAEIQRDIDREIAFMKKRAEIVY